MLVDSPPPEANPATSENSLPTFDAGVRNYSNAFRDESEGILTASTMAPWRTNGLCDEIHILVKHCIIRSSGGSIRANQTTFQRNTRDVRLHCGRDHPHSSECSGSDGLGQLDLGNGHGHPRAESCSSPANCRRNRSCPARLLQSSHRRKRGVIHFASARLLQARFLGPRIRKRDAISHSSIVYSADQRKCGAVSDSGRQAGCSDQSRRTSPSSGACLIRQQRKP